MLSCLSGMVPIEMLREAPGALHGLQAVGCRPWRMASPRWAPFGQPLARLAAPLT